MARRPRGIRLSRRARSGVSRFREHLHRRDPSGKFADKPGAGDDAPRSRGPVAAQPKQTDVGAVDRIRFDPSVPGRPTRGEGGARFAKYEDGMTIEEAVAAVGGDRKKVLQDLAWAKRRGFIRFEAGVPSSSPRAVSPPPPPPPVASISPDALPWSGPLERQRAGAFDGYGEDRLARAVAKAPPLQNVKDAGRGGSWYNPKVNEIHMGARRGSEDYARTWRHEYGHHLDYTTGTATTVQGPGPQLVNGRWVRPGTVIRRTVGEEMVAHIDADSVALRATPVSTQSSSIDVTAGSVREQVNAAFKRGGADLDYDDIAALIGPRAKEIDVAVVTEHLVSGRYADALISMRDRRHLSMTLSSTTPRSEVDTIMRLQKDAQQNRGYTSLTYVADMVGAATRNRVGWGHSKNYYAQDPRNRSTEIVANYWTVAAGPGKTPEDRAAYRLSRLLMPRTTKALDDYFGAL